MRIDQFLLAYPQLITSEYGEAEFAAMRVLAPGLSSPKLGKLLNVACRHLEQDEVYLEIGTFTGYSLVSASHQNSAARFIGIDNFSIAGMDTNQSQRDWVKMRLSINLEHWSHPSRLVIDSDFRNVTLEAGTKIGVFYIDGKHTYDEVIDNFNWAEQYLSDNALIVIDDISIAGVSEAISEWVKGHSDYSEFFRMHVKYRPQDIDHYSPAFWNGLSMVQFKRSAS